MYQQKFFFVAIVAAGCVALVASQSMDVQQCTQTGQKLVSGYAQELQGIVGKFSDGVSKEGSNAINIEGFSKETNELMKQIAAFADTSNFDVQTTLNRYYQIVQSQIRLTRFFFNPNVGLSLFRQYTSFASNVLNANSNFVLNLSSACVPQTRSSGAM